MPRHLGIKIETAKRFFVDRKAVQSGIDKVTLKTLARMGAFIMTTARRSQRKRKRPKPSPPGSPPFARTPTKQGLRHILYGVNPSRRNVIVGPIKFNASGRDVPNLMEQGGSRQLKQKSQRTGTVTRVVTVRYPSRPFMLPALEQEAPKTPQVFRQMTERQRFRSARRMS